MGTLALENVSKSYGALEVVHKVSFQVNDGEFIALVGPSGCGKTTLLRMIAGLEAVSDGIVSIDGKMVNEVAPKDRDVAMVFQSYALYPHMTVRDNMGFALKMAGAPQAEARKSVDRAAEILGLGPYMNRRPKELSGGQRQRVAMGRAIVRNPELFLFDEPLSNLDAQLRIKVRADIQALHQRLKTTTIYVTHDQVEAMTLADRLVVLRDGKVEQIGSPLDLYDRPSNIFVASFIGSPPMNLIEGSFQAVVDGATSFRLARGGAVVNIPYVPTNAQKLKDVTMGIRPEQIFVADGGWPVVVRLVETMGHESQVTGAIGDVEIAFTMKGRVFPKPGETVAIGFDPEALHVFVDGQRVN